jgi:hypothetical protein
VGVALKCSCSCCSELVLLDLHVFLYPNRWRADLWQNLKCLDVGIDQHLLYAEPAGGKWSPARAIHSLSTVGVVALLCHCSFSKSQRDQALIASSKATLHQLLDICAGSRAFAIALDEEAAAFPGQCTMSKRVIDLQLEHWIVDVSWLKRLDFAEAKQLRGVVCEKFHLHFLELLWAAFSGVQWLARQLMFHMAECVSESLMAGKLKEDVISAGVRHDKRKRQERSLEEHLFSGSQVGMDRVGQQFGLAKGWATYQKRRMLTSYWLASRASFAGDDAISVCVDASSFGREVLAGIIVGNSFAAIAVPQDQGFECYCMESRLHCLGACACVCK